MLIVVLLPAAVGAEEAEDLAASDGERDAADGLDLAVGLGEPDDLNCGWCEGIGEFVRVNVLIDAPDDWCRWMVVRLSRVPLNFGGGPHDRRAAITLSWPEKKKREEEAEQERRRREEAEKARQREIAEIPLEERAARAAEEKKQKQAAQREAYRRSLRDDIVPHAVDIAQGRLGVTTDPDDWVMPDDDSAQECLTLVIGGVSVMVQRTLEVNYDHPSAHSDSYCSDYFYRGWIWNRAKEEYEQLSLATFGEAQNAQPPSKGSGMPAFRDMWSMMLAITESDAQAIDTIWNNGDHVKMFTWAMSTITALLQGEGLDPADYARRALAKAAVDEAEGKVY